MNRLKDIRMGESGTTKIAKTIPVIKWLIGCSGFHYKHWKEIFYPNGLPQRKWFEYYCEHFNTLELNVTFYRFPRLEAMETWNKSSPAHFTFSVKVPKAITHYKKFIGTERMLSDFYNTTREGLGSKLGCVLFQLSPRSIYTEERLERIVASLDYSFTNVLEFRHPSWWNKDVYRELSKNKISFCGMSHPDLPADVIQNTKNLYYRFHGVPEVYKSKYNPLVLREFANQVQENKATKIAYVYFNNDIGGSAIADAQELLAYCRSLQNKNT